MQCCAEHPSLPSLNGIARDQSFHMPLFALHSLLQYRSSLVIIVSLHSTTDQAVLRQEVDLANKLWSRIAKEQTDTSWLANNYRRYPQSKCTDTFWLVCKLLLVCTLGMYRHFMASKLVTVDIHSQNIHSELCPAYWLTEIYIQKGMYLILWKGCMVPGYTCTHETAS